MKKTIKKDGNKVRLIVTLSKEEMQSEKMVSFSYRDAKVYMKEKKYDIKNLLEHKLVINKGIERNNKGEFVFSLKEMAKPKKETKPTTTQPKESDKPLAPVEVKTTTRRTTSTRKKKDD